MKTKKNIIVAALLICLLVLSFACSSEGIKDKTADKSKSETEQLEEIKLKKQTEADSLKNEIEMLKQKRDSLNKALENETKN